MKTLMQKFWERVSCSGGCWEWTGSRTVKGYGRVKHEGRTYAAHRLSWTIHFGEIEEGLCVCHTCDNPGCVHPGHLFLGTHADNQHDCYQKGRRASGDRHGTKTKPGSVPKGETSGMSKLDDDKVRHIREMQGILSQQELADMYGVWQTTISMIQRNRTWKHVK